MGCRMMVIALARAVNMLITWLWTLVRVVSFLSSWLCQELMRAVTHLAPACSGMPRALMTPSQPKAPSRSRVLPLL